MRVTALSTAGVRVKNESMYVSQYFLAYKRDGDTRWRHYHKNDVSVTVKFHHLSLLPTTSKLLSFLRLYVGRNFHFDLLCLHLCVLSICLFVFLVFTHVTRRPCWKSIQYKFLSQNLHIKFSSQWRNRLLFLPTNMAAMTSHALWTKGY